MGGFPVGTIISAIIAFIAIIYYIVKLVKIKDKPEYDFIFSRSSQMTFLVFLLCFGGLLVWTVANGLSGIVLIKTLIVVLMIVSVTNMVSIMYYTRQLNKQKH